MTYSLATMASPVGDLRLVASDRGLHAVRFETVDVRDRLRLAPLVEDADHPVLRSAANQLAAFFAGVLTEFRLPLRFEGTAFQMKVWDALLRIPFGELRTYGQIAREIGHSAAVRAVGSAANRNPIAIVAPCHRVVGASGALTGFAGGLAAKIKLLELEGRSFAPRTTFASRQAPSRMEGLSDEPTPSLFGP